MKKVLWVILVILVVLVAGFTFIFIKNQPTLYLKTGNPTNSLHNTCYETCMEYAKVNEMNTRAIEKGLGIKYVEDGCKTDCNSGNLNDKIEAFQDYIDYKNNSS